jgi:FkbM family methyltransferase
MGMIRSPRLRALVDTHTPALARAYRRARDILQASRFKPEPTGLGFSILRGREYANRLVGTELPAFQRCLVGTDLFVDVGANVGFFTLLASREGVRTLAIEPSPVNLKHLYRNLRQAAGPGPVEIFPIAISDAVGVIDLLGSGQGASVQPGWGGIAANYATSVPMTTLDSILSGREGRLLIKIDVEGNENAVLRGASTTLARSPRPTWLVEHGPEVRPGYIEFFDEFWERDYRVIALPETGGGAPYPIDRETAVDWEGRRLAPELMFLCEPAD